jgi:hypothetical protein
MADPSHIPRPFRRIVVRFPDASGSHPGVLAAARLARLFQAELAGLFIEDAQLLELSALPLMRHLRASPGGIATTGLEQLGQDFAAAAALARGRISRIGREFGLATTFTVIRGNVASLAFDATASGDLLVVVEPADPMARMVHPFLEIVRGVASSPAPILYAPHRLLGRTGPVVALAHSPLARAGEIATAVAASMGERLLTFESAGNLDGLLPASVDRVLAGTSESLIVIDQALLTPENPEFPAIAARRRVPILIAGEGRD